MTFYSGPIRGLQPRTSTHHTPDQSVKMLPVLVDDPCLLLDPVRREDSDRFLDLARDYDGAGGRRTQGSLCEARLSLTLERARLVRGRVERPLRGDMRDGQGQVWDYKQPHSRRAIAFNAAQAAARRGDPPPPRVGYAGEFDLERERLQVLSEQAQGEGVVLDLRRLTYDQAVQLKATLESDNRVNQRLLVFFPADLEPYRTPSDV